MNKRPGDAGVRCRCNVGLSSLIGTFLMLAEGCIWFSLSLPLLYVCFCSYNPRETSETR